MAVNKVVFGDETLVDLTETSVTPEKMLEGVTALDKTGAAITGTIPTVELNEPYIDLDHDTGKVTVMISQEAGYIASPVGKGTTLQLLTVEKQEITPGTTDQTIGSGGFLTGAQTIKGDPNLLPENIKTGVRIFGVEGSVEEGTDTSDATAAAEDIVAPETAYVNGVKVTGTNPYKKITTDSTVATQSDLIEQIKTALEGKAAGDSGGVSVDTCTVQVDKLNEPVANNYNHYITCTRFVDGSFLSGTYEVGTNLTTGTLTNVVCNTLAVADIETNIHRVSGCESILSKEGNIVLLITAGNGETATITPLG